jgi:hypothetical protein
MRVTGPVDTLTRATPKIIASANGCTDTPRPPKWRCRRAGPACKAADSAPSITVSFGCPAGR